MSNECEVLELSKKYVREAVSYYGSLGYPLRSVDVDLPSYVVMCRKLLFDLARCYGQVLTVVSAYLRGVPIRLQMFNQDDYDSFVNDMNKLGVSWTDVNEVNLQAFIYNAKDNQVLVDGSYELRSLYAFMLEYVEMIVVVLQMWMQGVSDDMIYNRIRLINIDSQVSR